MNITNEMISNHAQERMKERVGIKNFKEMQRLSSLAKSRGIYADTNKPKFKKALMKHTKNTDLAYLVIYNNYYFIYSKEEDNLITVYPVEKRMEKSLSGYRHKERIKNAIASEDYDLCYQIE